MPSFILSAPVIVKVLGSLLLILLLNQLVDELLVSMLAGALLLGFWSGHSAGRVLDTVWRVIADRNNLLLLVVLWLVITLSSLMARSGVMQDLVAVVRSRFPRRLAVAILPAVIGLIPMPGGAWFSAPLVDSVDGERALSGLLKSRTNYWFRHVWEAWWPLYPGVLLALSLTGLEVWQFIVLQIPFTLMLIAGGYAFLLRRIPNGGPAFAAPAGQSPAGSGPPGGRAGASFLRLTAPIGTVIGVYALARLLLPGLMQAGIYLPMLIGLAAALAVLRIQRPLSGEDWTRSLFSMRSLLLVLLVMAIRVYGGFIEARLPAGDLLVERMRLELETWGVPLSAVMALVPFISGLSTGIAVGFVGASFPIVISLAAGAAGAPVPLSAVALAYGFGFLGMMLSPVHACLIVSNQYFKARLFHSLRGLLAPVLATMAALLLYTRLLQWLA